MTSTRPDRRCGPSRTTRRVAAASVARAPRLLATASAIVVAGLFGASIAGPVTAASPAPSDAPVAAGFDTIEAWLDEPLTPDTPAGQTLPIGMTIWDTDQRELSSVGGIYLKLHPATGRARPTEAETRSDWPGHILANVIVPKGGPGEIEVGVRGRSCTSDGTCKDADFPFAFGGTGPPPAAPRSLLVTARIEPPVEPVVAGRPMDIVVDVAPKAAWDPASLGLPDVLVVIATTGRGPDLASSEIRLGAGPGSPYRGQITIPDPGDIALEIVLPGNGDADDVIPGATSRVTVGEPVTPGRPAVATEDVDTGIAWPLIGGAIVLVLLASLVISRVFADL